jgi:hypothetical protein
MGGVHAHRRREERDRKRENRVGKEREERGRVNNIVKYKKIIKIIK